MHTTYFGPISWYRELLRGGEVSIDNSEHYVKQTTRNHCRIAGPNGVQKLTVPVSIPHHTINTHHLPPITQIRLSDHGKWRSEHWNALSTAYGESPFFDYYADDLRPFFECRDWEYLFDFNQAILEKMLELLGIDFATHYHLSPNTQHHYPAPYWQVYQQRHGFLPDLSILDLLFCLGPEAPLYLLSK